MNHFPSNFLRSLWRSIGAVMVGGIMEARRMRSTSCSLLLRWMVVGMMLLAIAETAHGQRLTWLGKSGGFQSRTLGASADDRPLSVDTSYRGWDGNPDSLRVYVDTSWSRAARDSARQAMDRWNGAGGKPKLKMVDDPAGADVQVYEDRNLPDSLAGHTDYEEINRGRGWRRTRATVKVRPDRGGTTLGYVLTHEFGHVLGLNDENDSTEVMYHTARPGDHDLAASDSAELRAAVRAAELAHQGNDPNVVEPARRLVLRPGESGIVSFPANWSFPPESTIVNVFSLDPARISVGRPRLENDIVSVPVQVNPSMWDGEGYVDISLYNARANITREFLGRVYVNRNPVPDRPINILAYARLIGPVAEGLLYYLFVSVLGPMGETLFARLEVEVEDLDGGRRWFLCPLRVGDGPIPLYLTPGHNYHIRVNADDFQGNRGSYAFELQPCLTNQIILNTGYDPSTSGTLPISNPSLPPGSPGWDVPDPYWTVIQDPLPGTNEPRPASVISTHPQWQGPLPGSQWIAVYNHYSNSTNGVYVFRRCFCIEKPGIFVVSLQALADDVIDSILVCGKKLTNRTSNYTHNWFKAPPREYIDTLQLAENCCIEVYVRNTNAIAFGLNIAGSVTPLKGTLLADTCCRANTGWIQGQKYHDLNCNGKIDPGEPVLSGWTIQATAGSQTYTTTTGSDGWYNLAVPPGTYTISEQLQPGYTGAPGASGPYTVTVGPGQVAQVNFLNCTAPPPCDTIGQIHLDSACCQFTIPIFQPSGVPAISQIQWQLSGGTMESITLPLGCPGTLTPPNPFGTTSGTISFTPPCNANPLNLQMEVTPTTANGVVTLFLTINHGPDKVCRDTVTVRCTRTPITKCDRLAVSPFVWSGLNLSGRTFKIFNQKMPPSPIKEVQISFTPPPCVSTSSPQGDWNGGGLYVDVTSSPRSWGVGNSGTPKYSQISMDCDTTVPPPAPQGAAANNYVQFNLGIDYTCNWTGTVTFTVIHCDGDTCKLSYDWCAKQNPKQCIKVFPIPIDFNPILFTGRLIASQTGIRDSAHAIGFIVVRLDSSMIGKARLLSTGAKLTKADAARSIEGIKHIDDNAILATVGDARNDERVPNEYTITPLFECERCDSVPYVIELYDKDANPIDRQVLTASHVVTSVGSNLIQTPSGGSLDIIPNPGDESVTLNFVTPKPGVISLEIVDALGRNVFNWSDYLDSAGAQQIGMSTSKLSVGRYQVRLHLPDGAILTAPLVIVR